ncbi:MAG: 2-dehydropantoate 2-reductase [Burkholderiales bacterium]|jgi:2-dehydropantoate 2-reductase|nr:2-dehydropantoate 2-reductase [Burkholderiales bacterium]
MRIAVMGAGGVGGYFGGQLARAGHEVAFIARGRHLAALRGQGLTVDSAVGPVQALPVAATDDPAELAPADVVLFCVKLWDVEASAAGLAPLLSAGGIVIPFQNGVESHQMLARALGAGRVAGGVAHIGAVIRAPGVIAHTGTMAKLRVGAFEAAQEPRLAEFVAAGKAAGIDIECVDDIRRSLWEKFVFLVAMSGATALARQPIGVVRADADLREVLAAAMRETVAVAAAHGVVFGETFVDRQMSFVDGLPAEMRSSMLNDLLAGNRLEAPWLAGAVARMAKAAGLPAPVNATVYAALKPYLGGAR